jgi:hypothetical protein
MPDHRQPADAADADYEQISQHEASGDEREVDHHLYEPVDDTLRVTGVPVLRVQASRARA